MTFLSASAIILSPRKKSSPHRKDAATPAKPHAELARRMLIGLHGLELAEGRRVSYAEIARRMGKIAPPARQVSTVTRWFAGAQSPETTAEMAILARVLGVDPGWLTYGDPADATGDAPILGPDVTLDVTEPRRMRRDREDEA